MISPTLAINERAKELAVAGKKVIKLGFGQSPFPVPESVVNSLSRHAGQKDYLPVSGFAPLREAVASFYQRSYDMTIAPDQVMIGPGSKELIFQAQLAMKRTLLLPSPSWVSYAPQAEMLGLPVHWMDTTIEDDWCLQAEVLEQTCKEISGEKLLILNTPSNPTGRAISRTSLIEIADICRRHGVIVISDEIYRQLHFGGETHSIADYYPEGTIISSGLSKWCGAGGWRLGTFVFPQALSALQDLMAVQASETFSCVSAPIQHAAVVAYQGGEAVSTYLHHSKIALQFISRYIQRTFQEAGILCPHATGGFYLFPSFEPFRDHLATLGIHTGAQLCDHILNTFGVTLLPGVAFGRPEAELSFRLSYVDFDGEAILTHLHLGGEFTAPTSVQAFFPNIHTAISQITSWVTPFQPLLMKD